MNPYIDYPAAVARHSMNSGTMGQLWRPTLEKIDIPAVEDFEGQRNIIRQHFGTTPPASFRAASVTVTGKCYAQVVHIHNGHLPHGYSVVLAKDSRGIEHIMFRVNRYKDALRSAGDLANALIPPRAINTTYSPRLETTAKSFYLSVISTVAKAISSGEYKWPTLDAMTLPPLPSGAIWCRAFMSDVYVIRVAANPIAEYQISSYIRKHLQGGCNAV